jgi:hypothetical protein
LINCSELSTIELQLDFWRTEFHLLSLNKKPLHPLSQNLMGYCLDYAPLFAFIEAIHWQALGVKLNTEQDLTNFCSKISQYVQFSQLIRKKKDATHSLLIEQLRLFHTKIIMAQWLAYDQSNEIAIIPEIWKHQSLLVTLTHFLNSCQTHLNTIEKVLNKKNILSFGELIFFYRQKYLYYLIRNESELALKALIIPSHQSLIQALMKASYHSLLG